MFAAEIETIKELAEVEESQISLSDDGFMSRGYVIDGGRLVFKLKSVPKQHMSMKHGTLTS